MGKELRKLGIKVLDEVPWGTHLCQFYKTKEDLIDILVPYFKTGLKNNEFCMWVTAEPLEAGDAKKSLKKVVKNLDSYIKKDQIEILDANQWYTKTGRFDAGKVLRGWIDREKQALEHGFDGIRIAGNASWLERKEWKSFVKYEEAVNNIIGKHRMISTCSYPLDKCGVSEIIDIVSNHQPALIKRHKKWEIIESSEYRRKKGELAVNEEQLRQLTENIREVFWIGSIDANEIHYISPTYEEVWGRSCDSLYKQPRSWLDAVVKKDRKKVIAGIEKKINGDLSDVSFPEYQIIRPDGSVRWISSRTFPIKNENGEVYRIAGIAEDFTERKQEEELLYESKERYRAIFEQAADSIVLIDVEIGELVEFNQKAYENLGYTREEFKKLKLHDFEVIESVEKVKKHLKKIIKKGTDAFETKHRTKGGEVRDILVSSKAISIRGKNFVQSIWRDISERKRTEEALKVSEKKYQNLIEFADAGIIVSENEGITQMNKKAEEIYGYSKEELFGKPASVLVPDQYKKQHRVMLNEIVKTGKARRTVFEEEGIRKDGSLVPIEISFALLEVAENTVISVIRDITERKEAEKRVKETRDFLESILNTSVDGIIVNDSKGSVILANEAAAKIMGYSREEFIGNHTTIFVPREIGQEEGGEELITKLFERGVVIGDEHTWVRKDGNLVDVEVNAALLRDNEGNPTGSVASIRDITERKEMEKKFLQSEKLKSLGELAGGVAHDFNNVLSVILGRAQLLKMGIAASKGIQERMKSFSDIRRGLDIIVRAAEDGAETVRRIQEFSRRKDEDKYFTSVSINEVIDHALEFTEVRWKDKAESKGTKINIRKEFSPLPLTVGSSSELREVFINLINNAVDAMPQGGTITIKTFKEDSHISIILEDTGTGVHEAVRDKIFDPFFTTKGVKSTGLGLSVSYGIINRHRGSISVDSVEGQGTTFSLELPISELPLAEEEEVKTVSRKKRKASILVIEDEEEVRSILSDILINDGHKVEVAFNGSQGVKKFKKDQFDLVFTDLGMPKMSGWQVAEKIKSINSKVPVALITGWDVKIKSSEMKKSGIDLIIQKPFKVDQVLRLVQEGIVLRDRFKAM